jgi:Fe2+ transport system protein FeoA
MNANLKNAFVELATSRHPVRPNYYTGSGRWSRRSTDYAGQLVKRLEGLGMVQGRHFEVGNDAPFGGHTGEWVKLTPLGRRRKVFQKIRVKSATPGEEEPPKPVAPIAPVIRHWHEAGAAHPAPDEVVAAKRESGLTWKMIADQA